MGWPKVAAFDRPTGLYALYRNVYDQSAIHFDLLSAEFFRAVLRDAASGGVVFTYRAAGKLIGYNLCFVHGGKLLDKYVGQGNCIK